MQKELPVLSSREGCLGICTLMFRSIAEGFTGCALWFLPSKVTSNSKFQSWAAINMIIPNFRFYWPSDEIQKAQANTWGYMRWHGVHLPILFIDLILPFIDFRSSLVDGSSRHLISPLNCIFKIGSLKMHCKKMCGWSMNRGDKKKDRPLLSRRERCLGVCNLMFCNVPEGFMNIGLQLLPSKAPSESKFRFRAATYMIVLNFILHWRTDKSQEIQAKPDDIRDETLSVCLLFWS